MPLALLRSKSSGGSRDTASSSKDFTLVTQGRNQEKAIIATSSLQTHAAHQLWLYVLPPFFSLIQNGFLLITIILKVLKHINRWLSRAYKGASRLAFMALSNSSWYFIQQQIQFSSYKRVSIPEKIQGLIWHSESAQALDMLLCRFFCCCTWRSRINRLAPPSTSPSPHNLMVAAVMEAAAV